MALLSSTRTIREVETHPRQEGSIQRDKALGSWSEMYNTEGCPPGFAQDHWLDVSNSTECILPIDGFVIFCDVWSALVALHVLPLFHLSYLLRRRNRKVSVIGFSAAVGAILMVAVLQTKGETTTWAFALFGMLFCITFFSALLGTDNTCKSIPDIFAAKLTIDEDLISKDSMVRINYFFCTLGIVLTFVAFTIVVPVALSRENTAMAVIAFKFGSAGCGLTMITLSFIGFRSMSLLKNLIDSLLESGLNGDDENKEALRKTSQKLRVFKMQSFYSGFVMPTIWILHVIFLPFHWYLVLVQLIIGTPFYTSQISLYYLGLVMKKKNGSSSRTKSKDVLDGTASGNAPVLSVASVQTSPYTTTSN